MTALDDLGSRICVLGRSASGKSTIAAAVGRALDLPVVHLDRLRFLPGPGWRERDDAEFERLHAEAVAGERWVIEGGYSPLLPARLARATGVVLLDVPTPVALARYLRRTLRPARRVGGVHAGADRVTWEMVRWITGPNRAAGRSNRARVEPLGLPTVDLRDAAAVRRWARAQRLDLPT